MIFKEVELTDKILSELIACSEAWEQENSCHGYRKNTEEDIKGNRIFLALENEQMVGYLFGYMDKGERKNSIYEKDEPFFEVEELYVKPELRITRQFCTFIWTSWVWSSGMPGYLRGFRRKTDAIQRNLCHSYQ